MQPRPPMLPAPIKVPPDQMRLLPPTEDPEDGKGREAKEYDDKSATFCESAILCVLFSFIAALIVFIVFVVVEVASGRWDVPVVIALITILGIVVVILMVRAMAIVLSFEVSTTPGTLKKKKEKRMQLIVSKKNVYGVERVYPVCKKARLFANISGNKTLLPEVIEMIKELGYNLTTESEKI